MRSIALARSVALAAFAAAATLAACGGGGSSQQPPVVSMQVPSSAPVGYLGSVLPSQVILGTANGVPSASPLPGTVIASGFNGSLRVFVAGPQIVTVAPAAGAPESFTVTPTGSGQTSVVFTDSVSATIVPVMVDFCVPPIPYLNGPVSLGAPTDRQTGVSVNVARILFWQQNLIGPADPPFTLRLVGSNGTVVTGSHLAIASPPPGVALSVPPNAVWSASTVPALSAATLYQAQLVSDIACLPQQAIGTFST